jgi:type I restriction enzyme R subunit
VADTESDGYLKDRKKSFMILDKSEMTEEDVKLQFITPAILAKWDSGHVTMESKNSEAQYE